MAFYSQVELEELGFKYLGQNVKLSKLASIYNPQNIEIGDNSRIDDFCVLSAGVGGIKIGAHIHVAVYSSLIGGGKIELSDFCNVSSRVSIYSSNDDYSGEYMTNPTIPSKFTNVSSLDVLIKKHVIIGSGSVILPGVTLCIGSVIGALSLVKESIARFSIVAGVPARVIGKRKNTLLILEKKLGYK